MRILIILLVVFYCVVSEAQKKSQAQNHKKDGVVVDVIKPLTINPRVESSLVIKAHKPTMSDNDITNQKKDMVEMRNPKTGKLDGYVSKPKKCTEEGFRYLYKYILNLDYKDVDPTFKFPENRYPLTFICSIITKYADYPQTILDLLRDD